MSRKRKGAGVVVALAAAAAGAALWWHFRPQPSQAGPEQGHARAVRRDFVSSVLATGAVQPQVGAEVRVGSRISGKVERLHANVGDAVAQGQVIAELEKADLLAAVAQRQAELEMAAAKLSAAQTLGPREVEKAEADVAGCQATLALATKELARQEDLLKKDFTSQQARDRALEQRSVAAARLAAAEKSLELARSRYAEDLKHARAERSRSEAALAYAQVQLSYATIRAPISGVIASVSTQEGETVAAGLNAPTFVTIIDLKRLQLDAYVDEVDIGKIRPGQKAVFSVDAFPAREFQGRTLAIHPKAVIQDNVVNYDVVIEITSEYEGLLRPEMTASVTVFLERRAGVLAIPARAVKRRGGRNLVYVLTGGRAEPRPIRVGWEDGPWIEVVSGLEEGQTVLLEAPGAKSARPDDH